MNVIEGGLSKEQAVAIRIRQRLEMLQTELDNAAALGMEVTIGKSGTSQVIHGAQSKPLTVSLKATL